MTRKPEEFPWACCGVQQRFESTVVVGILRRLATVDTRSTQRVACSKQMHSCIVVFSDINRSSPSSRVVSLVRSSLPKVLTNPYVQHHASFSLDTLRF